MLPLTGPDGTRSRARARCRAPEILALKPTVHGSEDVRYDGTAVDVWSIGVLVYVCMCGMYPFEERTARGDVAIGATLQNISSGKYRPLPAGVGSPECLGFVRDTLRVDLPSRPSMEQLCRHPWFRAAGYDVSKVTQNWPPPEPAVSSHAVAATASPSEGGGVAGAGKRGKVKTKRTLLDKCRNFLGMKK